MIIEKVYSRLITRSLISYIFPEKQDALPIMKALAEAIQVTEDCIYCRNFHSDQGWGYQMKY